MTFENQLFFNLYFLAKCFEMPYIRIVIDQGRSDRYSGVFDFLKNFFLSYSNLFFFLRSLNGVTLYIWNLNWYFWQHVWSEFCIYSLDIFVKAAISVLLTVISGNTLSSIVNLNAIFFRIVWWFLLSNLILNTRNIMRRNFVVYYSNVWVLHLPVLNNSAYTNSRWGNYNPLT